MRWLAAAFVVIAAFNGSGNTCLDGTCSAGCTGTCTPGSADCLVQCGSAKCPCTGAGCD